MCSWGHRGMKTQRKDVKNSRKLQLMMMMIFFSAAALSDVFVTVVVVVVIIITICRVNRLSCYITHCIHISPPYNAHKTLHLICTTRIITLSNWIGQHHLSTQALSSFIYYCYFCCIDIQYCTCIFFWC